MFLISSFISIVLNPAIQNVLPVGGDSRKQVYMIFFVAVFGCSVFIIYATGLFLRYKSKEMGVFLALRAEKKRLSKALYFDLSKIIVQYSGLGIIMGVLMAFLALQVFKALFPFSVGNVAVISVNGVIAAVLFCVMIGFFIIFMAAGFTKRTNIMDILNEQRKNESLKGDITKKYFMIGIVCMAAGILISGVAVPVYTVITKQFLGAWTNIFYLLSAFGIYRVLIYSIAVHKKGKNPQKYYKNIISYGLLKFQGSSIVRNMLVVSLLIICSLFACLYSPAKYMTEQETVKNNPVDFSFYYPQNADEPDKNEIEQLAQKYEVTIKNYHEAEFIRLLGSGVNRNDIDRNGKLIELYRKEHKYYSFLNESAYNQITGSNLKLEKGTYKFLINDSMYENIYNKFSDLDYVVNQYTGISKELKYGGTELCSGLVYKDGFGGLARYIISDSDYQELAVGIPKEMKICNVLFDVEDLDGSYEFVRELYKEYCMRTSENMLHMHYYDEFEEKISVEKNGYYGYSGTVKLNPEHSEEHVDWKYAPFFKILDIKNAFLSFSIFYMLFIYVMIICMAAVGIICYTRSMTVVVKNQKVFEDVRKLRANNGCLKRILTSQIRRVYVLPTMIGCFTMLLWYPIMLWQNDGRLTGIEMQVIGVELFLCFAIAVYQYVIYRVSMDRLKK